MLVGEKYLLDGMEGQMNMTHGTWVSLVYIDWILLSSQWLYWVRPSFSIVWVMISIFFLLFASLLFEFEYLVHFELLLYNFLDDDDDDSLKQLGM